MKNSHDRQYGGAMSTGPDGAPAPGWQSDLYRRNREATQAKRYGHTDRKRKDLHELRFTDRSGRPHVTVCSNPDALKSTWDSLMRTEERDHNIGQAEAVAYVGHPTKEKTMAKKSFT